MCVCVCMCVNVCTSLYTYACTYVYVAPSINVNEFRYIRRCVYNTSLYEESKTSFK